MKIKAVVLSFISGILLFLSFPKFGTAWCAWVALVPLLFALDETDNVLAALLFGFIAGFVYNLGIIYWVIHVIVHYGGIPLYLAIFIMLLLAAYLGLYVSLFAAGAVYLKNKGIHIFAAAPFLWTVLEYAKAYLLSGFPWENLAYSQWSVLPIIQIADVTGIYGITFLIIIVNTALFEIIRTRFARKSLGVGLIA